jgi:DnaJ family protein A protein 2
MSTAYYEILGVSKTASPQEIKKGFRKKSLIFHPDRPTGDEVNFKEINQAYEVLSDPETRKKYDQFGPDFEKHGNGMMGGGMNMNDIFRGMHQQQHRQQIKKCEDIQHVLNISLKEVYNGATRKLKINRTVECTTCDGFGTKDKSESKCTSCHNGVKTITRQMGPMIQQMNVPCDICKGTGFRESNVDNKCSTCDGKRVLKKQTLITVNIKKGVQNRSILKFDGQAHTQRDCVPGDVIIQLNIDSTNTPLQRQGHNLLLQKTITLAEALSGFAFVVKQLDGRELYVSNTNRIITPNQLIKLKNEGLPIQNSSTNGDLIIQFTIEFPTTIQHTEILPKLFNQQVNTPAQQTNQTNMPFEFITEYKKSQPHQNQQRQQQHFENNGAQECRQQ